MNWSVILSNGERISSSDYDLKLEAWRSLKQYCEDNQLKITEMRIGTDLVDKNASHYFVVFSGVGFMTTGETRFCIGIGSYRKKSDKTRISWYNLPENRHSYTEVIKGKSNFIEEIAIEHDM